MFAWLFLLFEWWQRIVWSSTYQPSVHEWPHPGFHCQPKNPLRISRFWRIPRRMTIQIKMTVVSFSKNCKKQTNKTNKTKASDRDWRQQYEHTSRFLQVGARLNCALGSELPKQQHTYPAQVLHEYSPKHTSTFQNASNAYHPFIFLCANPHCRRPDTPRCAVALGATLDACHMTLLQCRCVFGRRELVQDGDYAGEPSSTAQTLHVNFLQIGEPDPYSLI